MSLFIIVLGLLCAGWMLCFLVRSATEDWKREDWLIAIFRGMVTGIAFVITLAVSAAIANLIWMLGAEPHQIALVALLPPTMAAGGAWFWTRGRL